MADAEQPGAPDTEPGAAPGQAGRPVSRAMDHPARREAGETAAPESRVAQGTADGSESTGRDLAGALEAAAAAGVAAATGEAAWGHARAAAAAACEVGHWDLLALPAAGPSTQSKTTSVSSA